MNDQENLIRVRVHGVTILHREDCTEAAAIASDDDGNALPATEFTSDPLGHGTEEWPTATMQAILWAKNRLKSRFAVEAEATAARRRAAIQRAVDRTKAANQQAS